jgi:alkanesulfonate monooxygenase SsuD/methylene tetrahydromethanopterin reductase-like flavin-dependent oxidoreductase (luciferase family)
LAARHAEVVFTAQQDIGAAHEFATGLRRQVADAGRDPRHCLIMPGLMPIIGATEAEAHDKLRNCSPSPTSPMRWPSWPSNWPSMSPASRSMRRCHPAHRCRRA